jgi:hypothetical protein
VRKSSPRRPKQRHIKQRNHKNNDDDDAAAAAAAAADDDDAAADDDDNDDNDDDGDGDGDGDEDCGGNGDDDAHTALAARRSAEILSMVETPCGPKMGNQRICIVSFCCTGCSGRSMGTPAYTNMPSFFWPESFEYVLFCK